jgi:aminomethyltransferase
MHSSYALNSEDFAVERGGVASPLSELWPGGYRNGDRFAVVVGNPMDPVGCSNLIGGTNTLFYDHLRETRGTTNFFRYADTYMIGIDCEPGDWNQLDVWPMHKFVSIMQPTAEAVVHTINDRRITHLAIPETGIRVRGPVVLSTWNTFLDQVKVVVLYNPLTGKAREADVALLGNKVIESYVEQAIFSTPGVGAGQQARLRRIRRNLDREPMRCLEEYRTLPNPAAARALLGVSEILPPGHQPPDLRQAPLVIIPVDQPVAAADQEGSPAAEAPGIELVPPPVPQASTEGLRKTAFDAIQRRMGGTFAEWEGWDWISDFGDPINEHHAVRETVGIWDESPLQKWIFRGPDALKAVDWCMANDMASMQVGQARYSSFTDEYGRMLGDGVAFNTGDETGAGIFVVTALPSDLDHFRRVTAGRFDVEILDRTERWPHVQVQGPKSRELLQSMTSADIEGLRYFRFITEPIELGGVPGCWVARTGYSGELGYEVYCAPEHAEALWQALLDHGGSRGIRPYGLAAVESLRIESGLIFIGYDYFQGLTSPFHMNLDRTINLEAGDFVGRDALRAELDAGITHRLTTLVIAGNEAPDYGADVFVNGRGVGKLTSPSAGRSPSVDRLIGMACLEAELAEPGNRVEVALPDGRLVPAYTDAYPIYDPEKTRPRG